MTIKSKIGAFVIPRLPVNRRAFDILRFESNCFWHRLGNALNPFYHRRVAAMNRGSGLGLNVGSGGRGSAGGRWVNVDARKYGDAGFALDIRRKLPFKDGLFKRIFAEHVFEHLDFREDIPRVLAEFHRVLSPGGTVRIVVPDAGRFLEAYVSGDREKWRALGWDPRALPKDIYTPMHVINHVFHQSGEHLFGYDFETLEFVLRRAGFDPVRRQAYRKSDDAELPLDQPVHEKYSLYVEAKKPQ